MNTLFFVFIASLCGLSNALALPVVSRSVQETRSPWSKPSVLAKRSMQVFGFLADAVGDENNVVNFQDTVYATNMTLGGQTFLIQLDTGSSDMWVYLPNAQLELNNVTNINATQTYGKGQVNGPIAFSSATIGPHNVPNQAFIHAANATDFGTIFGYGVSGILGLGFDQDSTVDIDILQSFGTNTTAGAPFLYQVFLQNTSAPPVFTVLLGRAADQKSTTEGLFTIGEYEPQYASVVDQPMLPRYPNSQDINTPNRWSVIMDGMSVNGNPYHFNTSGVPGVPEGSVVAVLDTGFSFPPLPKGAIDFIYGSIQGATFDNSSGLWIVPCENATTVEFTFGNITVPIHPLDLTSVTQLNNQTVCVNTFRATTFPTNPQFDIILGDAFLKNAYVSFNFGDFVHNHSAIPYVQMLPTTDLAAAFAEFNQARKVEFSKAQVSASAAPLSSATSVPTTAAAISSAPACSAPVSVSATAIPTDSSSDSSSPSSVTGSAPLSSFTAAPSSASYPGWSSYGPSSYASGADSTPSASAMPTSCPGDNSSSGSPCAAFPTSAPTDSSILSSTSAPLDLSSSSPSDSSTGLQHSTSSGTYPNLGLTPPMGVNPEMSMTGTDKHNWARREMQYLARKNHGVTPVPARKAPAPIALKLVPVSFVPVLEMYGAIVVSLISGAVVVSMLMFAVGVVLVLRSWSRSRSRNTAQYSVIEAKQQTEADPEAHSLSSPHYYYDD